MKKVEAENMFKEEVDYKKMSKTDQRVAWNDFVEYLSESNMITERQRNTWGHPKFIDR